jgi:hypothetical protein
MIDANVSARVLGLARRQKARKKLAEAVSCSNAERDMWGLRCKMQFALETTLLERFGDGLAAR